MILNKVLSTTAVAPRTYPTPSLDLYPGLIKFKRYGSYREAYTHLLKREGEATPSLRTSPRKEIREEFSLVVNVTLVMLYNLNVADPYLQSVPGFSEFVQFGNKVVSLALKPLDDSDRQGNLLGLLADLCVLGDAPIPNTEITLRNLIFLYSNLDKKYQQEGLATGKTIEQYLHALLTQSDPGTKNLLIMFPDLKGQIARQEIMQTGYSRFVELVYPIIVKNNLESLLVGAKGDKKQRFQVGVVDFLSVFHNMLRVCSGNPGFFECLGINPDDFLKLGQAFSDAHPGVKTTTWFNPKHFLHLADSIAYASTPQLACVSMSNCPDPDLQTFFSEHLTTAIHSVTTGSGLYSWAVPGFQRCSHDPDFFKTPYLEPKDICVEQFSCTSGDYTQAYRAVTLGMIGPNNRPLTRLYVARGDNAPFTADDLYLLPRILEEVRAMMGSGPSSTKDKVSVTAPVIAADQTMDMEHLFQALKIDFHKPPQEFHFSDSQQGCAMVSTSIQSRSVIDEKGSRTDSKAVTSVAYLSTAYREQCFRNCVTGVLDPALGMQPSEIQVVTVSSTVAK